MRSWTIFILLMLMVIAAGVAQAEGERKAVFRDLAWGDPPEALGNHRIQEDDGRVKTYTQDSVEALEAQSAW